MNHVLSKLSPRKMNKIFFIILFCVLFIPIITFAAPHFEPSKVTKIAEVTLNSQPPISDSEARAKAQEKIQKLRELSFKVKTPGGLAELENEPAYKRKNYTLNDTPHSSESEISRLTLGTENPANGAGNKTPSLRPDKVMNMSILLTFQYLIYIAFPVTHLDKSRLLVFGKCIL